jgi:aryl-alcohol dehydrogenase (NADP+)
MQTHYNLLYREEEREMLPFCREEGIGVIPWSPLARGLLTRPREQSDATLRAKTDAFGKSLYERDDGDFAVIDRVTDIAKKRGIANAQVALAWVLGQPGITAPIIGAGKPGHIEDAVAALDIKLDASELEALAEQYLPHAVAGHQ